MTDTSGRPLFCDASGYIGPERRATVGSGPNGLERRFDADAPITGLLSELVAQMRADNPALDQDAQAMQASEAPVQHPRFPPNRVIKEGQVPSDARALYRIGDRLPARLTSADMRWLFYVGPAQFYVLKAAGKFDRFELKPQIGRAAWCGAKVAAYLAGEAPFTVMSRRKRTA